MKEDALGAPDGERPDRQTGEPTAQAVEWTSADFESLSWHDCAFYGFSLAEREHGTADLEFDLDFIVEWVCGDQGSCEFRVAPATLTFHRATYLRIELDYASVSAGMTGFSIAGIERELLTSPTGYSSFRWRLPVNWPRGLITFESPGFIQILRQPPILTPHQALLPHQRGDRVGA